MRPPAGRQLQEGETVGSAGIPEGKLIIHLLQPHLVLVRKGSQPVRPVVQRRCLTLLVQRQWKVKPVSATESVSLKPHQGGGVCGDEGKRPAGVGSRCKMNLCNSGAHFQRGVIGAEQRRRRVHLDGAHRCWNHFFTPDGKEPIRFRGRWIENNQETLEEVRSRLLASASCQR